MKPSPLHSALQQTLALLARVAAASGWRARLAALLVLLLFYLATAAGNLSETDDAYAFAWRAEHVPVHQVSDPRLMLYHLLARGLWLAGQGLGLQVSGLAVLQSISLATALPCLWLLWRVLVQRLQLPREPALLAVAALGLSYGFWRYAVEADVYVPAMALTVGVLYGLLAPRCGPGCSAALGAAAGLAVLFYQPNTIPLFLALPWLVWRRHGGAAALTYVAAGVVVAGAGYTAGFLVYWPALWAPREFVAFLAQRSSEFAIAPLSPRVVLVSLARSAVTLGHDLAATQWAMGVAPIEALARWLFAGHDIDDEVFVARQAGAWAWLGLPTLVLLCVAAWRLWRAAGLGLGARAALLWQQPAAPVLLWWALLTALVIGRLNASGAEAWIVFLLPLWLLVALAVLVPAWQRAGPLPALLCVAALGVHNAVGGMALMHDVRTDPVRLRTDWLAAAATPQDLVVVVANLPVTDALRYHGRAQLAMISRLDAHVLARTLSSGAPPESQVTSLARDFAGADVHSLARRVLRAGGRVIVFGDFFKPVASLAQMRPGHPAELQALQARSPVLHHNADGSTVHLLAGPAR